MTLFDVKFVDRLRRQWFQIVKADPKLRADARRHRPRIWTRHRDTSTLRWVMPFIFAGAGAGLPSWSWDWYFLAAWGTCLALVRTHQLQDYYAVTAPTLLGLPISPSQILEKGMRACFQSSLWLLVDTLAMVGAAYIFKGDASLHGWAIVPSAILAWASSMATFLILMGWRPRWPYMAFAGGAFFLSVFATFVLAPTDSLKQQVFEYAGAALIQATPSGWACQVSAWLLGVHEFPVVPTGLLAFCLALTIPCYRLFRQRFSWWDAEETELRSTMIKVLTEDEEEMALEYSEDTPTVSRASAVEELVLRGDFLKSFSHQRSAPTGWMDRWILARFSRRASLLGFLLADKPVWGSLYRFGWKSLVIGSGLTWLASIWLLDVVKLAGGLTAVIAIAGTTPIFGGAWQGLQLAAFANRQLALTALLPVRLREISRAILAVNATRYLLALPCWIASFSLLGLVLRQPPVHAAMLGLKCWLISLLLQPFFLVFKYSAGTNDTSSGFLNALMFYSACLIPFVAAVAATLAVCLPAPHTIQGLGLAVLTISSFSFERFYRWLYASKRVDLVTKGA